MGLAEDSRGRLDLVAHHLGRAPKEGRSAVEALGDKYDILPQSVYDFRWRNKHRIAVVLAEWSNQFSDLWSVKKHARIADLQADLDSLKARQQELLDDAAAETDVMHRVDPEAVRVRVDGPEWRAIIREKARLSAQIEKSMGQEGRAGLRQQPKPLNIQPAAYVEPAPLSQIEQWEQDQHDARRLKIEQWLAQREAEYKRQHPNWRAEEAAEQEAFEVVFDAIWQRLGSDDAFRQAAAERFGPGYWLEADAMTDAHRIETLERQILLHAETRAEVAASLADADMNPTSEPVPVEDSAMEWLTAPGQLVARGLVDPRPVMATRIPSLEIGPRLVSPGGIAPHSHEGQ